jgi:hypothetical protein
MKAPTLTTQVATIVTCTVAMAIAPSPAGAATQHAPSAPTVAVELPVTPLAIPAWLPMPMWWSG